jgi:hypothetical protein
MPKNKEGVLSKTFFKSFYTVGQSKYAMSKKFFENPDIQGDPTVIKNFFPKVFYKIYAKGMCFGITFF